MDSQDLKSHQWKNRIILVLSDDGDFPKFTNQIDHLKKESNGCAERKLVMYQVVPSEIHLNKFDGSDSKKWNLAGDLYTEFMQKGDSFKLVLIGLDGSVKEERTEPIAAKELFEIIDGMSMRQKEVKQNN